MVNKTITISGALIGTPIETSSSLQWIFENCNLAVEDGLIMEVSTKQIPYGDYHIDAFGCVVLPTFVNAHTHGFEFAFKGFKDGRSVDESHPDWFWDIYNNATDELLELGSRIHFAECIMAGIGCVAEIIRHDIEGYKFQDILKEFGLRGRIFGASPGCNGFDLGSEVHPTFSGRLENAKLLMFDHPLHIHLLETDFRRERIHELWGMSTGLILKRENLLEHPFLLTHCGAAKLEDMKVFQNKRALVVATPIAEARLGEPSVDPSIIEKLGLPFAIGTDGPCYNPLVDMFEEMRTLLYNSYRNGFAWTHEEVLYAATLSPRPWLGETIQGIVEGAKADLQILSLSKQKFHPMVKSPYNNLLKLIVGVTNSSDVKATIVDGKLLYIDNKLTQIDLPSLLKDMNLMLSNMFTKNKIGALYETSL